MTQEDKPVKRKKGGPQPGSGRPKGRLNQSTIDAMAVKKEYQDKIRKQADRLFNAQMNLAEGVTMLFRVEKDSKGNDRKPELVTSQEEIAQFIEECGGYDGQMNGDTYYFLTTKVPDSRTISDMLDRAMGRPDTTLDVTTGGESLNKPKMTDEELTQRISEILSNPAG